MDVCPVPRIAGAMLFKPSPHVDERGFFSRTFDADVTRAAGIDPAAFVQDSLSRSARGVCQRRSNSGSGTVSVTFRGGLIGEEGAAAEQVGTGAAVHLAFEHFDAVDVPLDGAGAPSEA